jgi:glucose-1-phosphate thymidylyltransferase
VAYLNAGQLRHVVIPSDVQWIDAGTPDALVAASLAIQAATRDQASEFGYVEIAAYRNGYLDQAALLSIVDQTPSVAYAQRLRSVLEATA